jgi:hypothetical protein
VEVERALDRNPVSHLKAQSPKPKAQSPGVGRYVWSYDAVTTVLMPPRTEKSPTTVMRLG